MTAAALDDPAGQRGAGSAAPIRVGSGVPPPRKVHDVPPVYPSAARTLHNSVIRNEVVVDAGLVSRANADLTVGNLGGCVWVLEAVGARPVGVGSLPLVSP